MVLLFLIRYLRVIPIHDFNKVTVKKNEEDISMPIEKIMSVLNEIRDKIPLQEKKLTQDLDYCIEMISRNKMFSPNIFNDKNSVKTESYEVKRTKEEVFLVFYFRFVFGFNILRGLSKKFVIKTH